MAMSVPWPAPSTPPVAKRIRLFGKSSPFYVTFHDLGREDNSANQQVYLITISRLLVGSAASNRYRDVSTIKKQELIEMIRDAWENPVVAGATGGRPRTRGSLVDVIVVVQEAHADGSVHFHAAIKLFVGMRFSLAKQTLSERHNLATHWSCTHRQLWSVIRYLHVATPRKPRVDANPVMWTSDGRALDLTELSREPFIAIAWRKRGEKQEALATLEDKKAPAYNGLDLKSLILSKHLHTKASLLAYVQDYGSPACQLFVSRNQRRVNEHIEDAQEWADAKSAAGEEKMSDWEVLTKASQAPCAHAPGPCAYADAVEEIFRQNAATMSPQRLAASLREVLIHGPSKTCPVPFLVGPSNTGKSTLLYPFDDLYGPKHVFHKPALGSTFALRNIVKKKRLIFWDDFRPVEFADKQTVPVATFLSLFIGKDTEIQVSQSFNDGNLDVNWKRGVVFTAKEDGLWEPTSKVSAEDVRHLRNRVEEFRFTHVVHALKEVDSCAPCMARWIIQYSEMALPNPVPPPLLPTRSAKAALGGFVQTMALAKVLGPVVDGLLSDIIDLGAVHVDELFLSDWQALPSWKALRPLEARRLAAVVKP
jgi:hypothetical protein